ncbi:hypothetical protein [Clostridium perfringens]|uniref:hypothetical protein n=1 Tax=Clostridium perfringens TaxID=1502 RepID=UPI002ACE3265|nr:hypothetical protein [Clostridium perfringens]
MEDNREVREDLKDEAIETEKNEDINSTVEAETDESSDDIVEEILEEKNDKENELDIIEQSLASGK